jgi:hypothetical protein
MTTQSSDTLVDDENEYRVKPFPLSQLGEDWCTVEINGKMVPRFQRFSTSCHRGYLAAWAIKDEKLFLTAFDAYENGCRVNIEDVFSTYKLFASWYCGELKSNVGGVIYGFYEPTFEKNCVWEFERGVVKKRYVRTNNSPMDLESIARHWKHGNYTDTL